MRKESKYYLKLPKNKNRLLLHSCCAPCSGEIIQRLVDSSFDAVENAAPFPAFPKLITRKKMIIQVPVIYKIR